MHSLQCSNRWSGPKAEEVSLVTAHGIGHHRLCMTRLICNIWSRIVIVEGIMGSGNTFTKMTLTELLERLLLSGAMHG